MSLARVSGLWWKRLVSLVLGPNVTEQKPTSATVDRIKRAGYDTLQQKNKNKNPVYNNQLLYVSSAEVVLTIIINLSLITFRKHRRRIQQLEYSPEEF